MKLSEMTTERSFDVICEITPYLGNIVDDKNLMDSLKKTVNLGNEASQMAVITAGVAKVNKIVPIVLKKHKSDVYGILSVVFDTSIEKISKQNILKTMIMIREIIKDKDLVDFFGSCVG